jgi:pantothenate kinase
MDGFHLPRSVLDDLSNRKEAYARRGAAWTFDVKGILALVQLLRSSADVTAALRKPIYAPTFDHAIKDPVENGVLISGEVSIIILEGNYLLLDENDGINGTLVRKRLVSPDIVVKSVPERAT